MSDRIGSEADRQRTLCKHENLIILRSALQQDQTVNKMT